jgi:hypothetical protein
MNGLLQDRIDIVGFPSWSRREVRLAIIVDGRLRIKLCGSSAGWASVTGIAPDGRSADDRQGSFRVVPEGVPGSMEIHR